MEIQQSIITLFNRGWSERRIARELGIHRQTVKRYISGSKCTNVHTGKTNSRSHCEAYREHIKEWRESALSIERIHQDLTRFHGFTGSYYSVRRFVKSLEIDEPERVHRMECEPGQWSDGYFVATVGERGDWSVVERYVLNQGKPKEDLRQLELW